MKRLEINNKSAISSQIQAYFAKNIESRFIHRLHGILLFINKEDESCDSIGALFGNSPRTVSNWIKKIKETGNLESLRDEKRPGRTSRLSVEQQEELKVVIQKHP